MTNQTTLKPEGYRFGYDGRSVTTQYLLGKAEDGREVLVQLSTGYNGKYGRPPNRFFNFATGPVYRDVDNPSAFEVTTWDVFGTPRARWDGAAQPRFSTKGLQAAVKAAVEVAEVEAASVFEAARAVVEVSK